MPHLFPVLIAKGLCKTYQPAKRALDAVDLTVQPGQIHVLAGQSGAGKTALAECITGITTPSGGTLHLQGQPVSLRDRQAAEALGIRLLTQTWDMYGRATVCDALQLDGVPRRFGFVDNHALVDRAKALLNTVGLSDIDHGSAMSDLSAGKQLLVKLAGALSKPITLLVLDEPCVSLTAAEQEVFFKRLSQFQFAAAGIVYCTSSAEQALQVGDCITVLRDGRKIAEHQPDGVFVHQIEGEMLGGEPVPPKLSLPRSYGPEVSLRVESITVEHRLQALSLKLKRGEVLGLLGKYGAGQSEAVLAIGGIIPRSEGFIFVRASGTPSKVKSRDEAISSGIGLIPDPWARPPEAENHRPGDLSTRQLRGMNAENPQRAQIGKYLSYNCSVLLFDNPTRGLNVACRMEVCNALVDLADQGISIIAASTDPAELIQFCDRIAIMVDGRIKRTVERQEFNLEKIQAMLDQGV